MATALNDSGVTFVDTTVIDFSTDAGAVSLKAGGVTKLTIGSSGELVVPVGGVKFPATQVPQSDPNTLDDYTEYTSPSTACTGALTASTTYKVVKVGKVVTLTVQAVASTATNSTAFTVNPVLPLAFRPAYTTGAFCYIAINGAGVSTPGLLQIQSNGTINIYREGIATVGFGTAASTGLSNDATASWVV